MDTPIDETSPDYESDGFDPEVTVSKDRLDKDIEEFLDDFGNEPEIKSRDLNDIDDVLFTDNDNVDLDKTPQQRDEPIVQKMRQLS